MLLKPIEGFERCHFILALPIRFLVGARPYYTLADAGDDGSKFKKLGRERLLTAQ